MKERKIDVAFWPAEEVDGLALFRKLQQKWEQKDFDDEYLALLAEYKKKYPESEHVDIFAGYFSLYSANNAKYSSSKYFCSHFC